MTTEPKIAADRSAEVLRKHREYLWPAVTNFYQHPLVADRARMQYVWDLEGRKYLDFFGGILTISVGHTNPKVTAQDQGASRPPAAHLHALPQRSHRRPGRKSRPDHARQSAEKLLHQFRHGSQRSRPPAGAHGHRLLSTSSRCGTPIPAPPSLTKSITAQAPWRKAGVISVGVAHAINPYCYRCPLGLKYPDCGVACANDVENLIQTGTSGHIAAFIAEPIQGVGGFITPPPEYFKIVFNAVKKYGGLFISDEVQTGFGRTGKHWFGIEHWEVVPDIITCAKGMGNGVPDRRHRHDQRTRRLLPGPDHLHLRRQSGHLASPRAPPSTSSKRKTCSKTPTSVGSYFREKLEELQEKYPLIGDVRGMGLMQGLELVKDRKTKEPAPEATAQLLERTRENGLLVGKGGLYGNVIRLSPMLNIAKADVDEAVALLDKSFAEVRV